MSAVTCRHTSHQQSTNTHCNTLETRISKILRTKQLDLFVDPPGLHTYREHYPIEALRPYHSQKSITPPRCFPEHLTSCYHRSPLAAAPESLPAPRGDRSTAKTMRGESGQAGGWNFLASGSKTGPTQAVSAMRAELKNVLVHESRYACRRDPECNAFATVTSMTCIILVCIMVTNLTCVADVGE